MNISTTAPELTINTNNSNANTPITTISQIHKLHVIYHYLQQVAIVGSSASHIN